MKVVPKKPGCLDHRHRIAPPGRTASISAVTIERGDVGGDHIEDVGHVDQVVAPAFLGQLRPEQLKRTDVEIESARAASVTL